MKGVGQWKFGFLPIEKFSTAGSEGGRLGFEGGPWAWAGNGKGGLEI
jgi:hypothetical protein